MNLRHVGLFLHGLVTQINATDQAEQAMGRAVLLTLLLLLLLGSLVVLVYFWIRSHRRHSALADLNKELVSFEAMRRSGLLSEEEHRKIASRLREQIALQTVQQTVKEGETRPSDAMLIEILAAEASKLEARKKTGGASPGQKTEE
ncbi:MAG TPA: hypothetical protein PKH07_16695 [bacterium]|nr:hypothetical protein [bacterium]